ncbi:MAG: hypothetical protein M1819_001919 [Sarea resinae]|nr:MAG: hypothetical protein M1819_001919 [Sarea resinae]
MTIKTLPPATIQAIGSSQVLTDASSVAKELIDNALDARATSIVVEIATNTLDVIQVRDNGHGIAPEDRHMICRRHCTSKLREWKDLKDIGGTWLGFRGEALASAAEMSGGLAITTKVEGEATAALLKIGKSGDIIRQVCEERASHAVGTTIRITDFLKSLPVRRQTSLKIVSKTLSRTKDLLQAYAFARPTVRFSLRVLKAKTEKGNWTYAPKASVLVPDAVLNIMGKDVASQGRLVTYSWDDQTPTEGGIYSQEHERQKFIIEAFLVNSNAEPGKIADKGHFVSIDSRPVSSSRGAVKQIMTLYKTYVRSSISSESSEKLRNPFICMNIKCPAGSYDPNVEPAKDDVIFEDSASLLSHVESFFQSVYGDLAKEGGKDKRAAQHDPKKNSFELLLSRRKTAGDSAGHSDCAANDQASEITNNGLLDAARSSTQVHNHPRQSPTRQVPSRPSTPTEDEPSIALMQQRASRRNMYSTNEDIGEHDESFADEQSSPETEDDPEPEETMQSVNISNPWVLAKMNASVRRPLDIPGRGLNTDFGSSSPAELSRNSSRASRAPRSRRSSPLREMDPLLPTPQRSLSGSSSPARELQTTSRLRPRLRTTNNISRAEAKRRYGAGALDTWVQKSLGNSGRHVNAYDGKETDIQQDDDGQSIEGSVDGDSGAASNDFVMARDLVVDRRSVSPLKATTSRRQTQTPLRSPSRLPPPRHASGSVVSPMNDLRNVWFDMGSSSPPKKRPKVSSTAFEGKQALNFSPSREIRNASAETSLLSLRPASVHPDVEELLDYERRKQEAMNERKRLMAQKAELATAAAAVAGNGNPDDLEPASSSNAASTNTPHQNRFNAAIAALSSPSTTKDAGSSPFKDGDPRGYFIRAGQSASASGSGRLRRTKTALLPLETVPPQARTQNLTATLETDVSEIANLVRQTRLMDDRGGDECDGDTCVSGEKSKREPDPFCVSRSQALVWQHRLEALILAAPSSLSSSLSAAATTVESSSTGARIGNDLALDLDLWSAVKARMISHL